MPARDPISTITIWGDDGSQAAFVVIKEDSLADRMWQTLKELHQPITAYDHLQRMILAHIPRQGDQPTLPIDREDAGA